MRIITLIENTSGWEDCAFEHGLSLYIETTHHRIVSDTGATGAFLTNAAQLGIDLSQVDTVVLSHGHYDHTGGVAALATLAPQAAVYMQAAADRAFYHAEKYIGNAPEVMRIPGLRLLHGDLCIDDELMLFTGITGRRHWPESNRELTVEDMPGVRRQDDFSHEQCLVISEGGTRVLVSGCAHNGILNVLETYRRHFDADPDHVISGFHMKKKTPYTEAERETIRSVARELTCTKTVYHTGHCTGEEAFALMKAIMGEQLQRITSGCRVL